LLTTLAHQLRNAPTHNAISPFRIVTRLATIVMIARRPETGQTELQLHPQMSPTLSQVDGE